jgi:hypothetical protein
LVLTFGALGLGYLAFPVAQVLFPFDFLGFSILLLFGVALA